MKVKAVFKGIMKDWVGAAESDFDLKPGASYGDLLREIHLKFGRNLPSGLWNRKRKAFDESVVALVEGSGEKLDELATPLREGMRVDFFLLALGG